jgi:AraC-like DNA-binding protein
MLTLDLEEMVCTFFDSVSNPFGDTLFDALDDVQFFVKDAKGRYMKVNRALRDNYLMSDDSEIIGRTDHELFPGYLADNYVRDDRQVLRGVAISKRIELVGRYDGTSYWSQTSKVPLLSQANQVVGLAGVSCDLGQSSLTVRPYQKLSPATDYIEQNYGAPISMAQLASLCDVSSRSLQRRFRKLFRMTPGEYVRRVRINKASFLLAHSDLPIAAIASSCGFADQSHLTRDFSRMLGETPRSFRTKHHHKE